MIDSITKLCLSLFVCTNGLSYSGKKLDPRCVLKLRQTNLASEITNKINISCYTEYKAFGPSLIYNISKEIECTTDISAMRLKTKRIFVQLFWHLVGFYWRLLHNIWVTQNKARGRFHQHVYAKLLQAQILKLQKKNFKTVKSSMSLCAFGIWALKSSS